MSTARRIHFTGIATSVVADLAIALKGKGCEVSASCAGESEAAKRLTSAGIKAAAEWHPERLEAGLDALILDPIVKRDNSELHRALELKVPVYSYPEFIHQESVNKHRVVITGSHGKSMITLIILHILNYHNRAFDYVLVRPISGKPSVRLSNAPLIIIEGQDGPSSALDPTTIFLRYKHHVGLISGMEWFSSPDYPSKEEYARQFSLFESSTPKGGVLIYFDLEPVVHAITKDSQPDVLYVPYKTHTSLMEGGTEYLVESANERHPVKLSGKHNMQNLAAAKETVKRLGITTAMFYEAVQHFGGDTF